MNRSALVLLGVVLGLSLAPAAPVPPDAKPVLYYPAEVGARLTYTSDMVPEWVDEVTAVVWTREGALVTVRKQVDGEWAEERKVLVSDKGVFPRPTKADVVGVFRPQLRLPARPEDRWDWGDVKKTRPANVAG